MEILSAEQTRAWDAYTVRHEPTTSLALMDRAVQVFVQWFEQVFPDRLRPVCVCCGTGNNGGDGVGIAALLHHRQGRSVQIWLFDFGQPHSADFEAQWARLPGNEAIETIVLQSPGQLPQLPRDAILIDALFGSGLSRPLEGAWAEAVAHLNRLPCEKIAVDLPSGLFADRHTPGGAAVVLADHTFSFERPKLAFFFPENAERVGEWAFGSIGLHPGFLDGIRTEFHLLDEAEAHKRQRPRPKYAHKGTFGHALLIAGSYGKMGAAVLAARACLRSGTGLVSVHAPRCGNIVLQTAVPEAMFLPDCRAKHWSSVPALENYQSLGIGPGIGKEPETTAALGKLLRSGNLPPLVLDADALNLLSENPAWWAILPTGTILTPHPKEFERLFGPSSNDFERNALARVKAQEHGIYIVLKGAHTAIACPDGTCWFNNNGNPGMATAGSGDVLTGIITGLLAQSHPPLDACLVGVFLHGQAGDRAAALHGQAGMVAGDMC